MLPTRPAAPALTLRPTPLAAPPDTLAVMCPECGAESALDAVLASQVPGCPGCGYRYTVAAATA